MKIRSLEDIVAIEQANPDPFSSLTCTYDMIRAGAEINPGAVALSFFLRSEDFATPATWRYSEWLEEITRTANMLRRLGVQQGDVVAYVLPNLPEAHLAVWGGETAGIAFAVNTLLEGEQMGELLRAADTRWLITLGPYPVSEIWDRVESALRSPQAAGLNLQGILAVNALRHFPGSPAGSCSTDRAAELPETLAGVPVHDFHVELSKASGEALEFAAPESGDIASYFCTGGTTGLPKIAMHTHRNETANVVQLAAAVPELFRPGKTSLTCLPLFHVNAQLGTGLAAFAAGAHCLLGPPAGYRTPGLIERFWEVVAHHQVASFSGVPTVYAGLLQAPMEGLDLSCLDYAVCGAAPMPLELLNTFEQKTGMRMLEGYGLTECTAVASLTPAHGKSCSGSIGLRLPWESMRTLVLDEDGRYIRDAEVDETGVVALSGPNVFPGYLSDAHNASAWIAVPGQGSWLNTGDLGRRDADGYFWLTGRKKELIIRGGHNIDPKVIEEALAAHPAVALSAAVGRPDAHAGEVPVAYVQLKQPGSVSASELQAFAAQHIPERAAIPRRIYLIDSLPQTAVGKTFKPALSLLEVESVVREEAEAAGIALDTLCVEQDPRLGIVAKCRVNNDDVPALTASLGAYTFASSIGPDS
ncbi:acyl-CoA synthetase [Pseudohalioglobus lutimaris]|uniref:Acyl-CoA synthetase n=1 Tax=Pseudohalioglobus lutimaris TaxID=1737061 RepID=A0A2N5X5E2_9GAMM|nr:acyl-CoA synthetase [Pseudohalioglobus lutimaris]PLW69708.1 acyl-CoA synthetase [Pseudohalioglobus lutimaris]